MKPSINYIFNSSSDIPNNNNNTYNFYQISVFPNPRTNKFHIRKFIINSNDEFLDIIDYHLTKHKYHKFLKFKKIHEYKLFSTFSLDNISYPSMADISLLKSDNLSNNYNYSGFAPFYP